MIYLCIKVGTQLCETLQNGAEFRWSNNGRLRLEYFFNDKNNTNREKR